MRPKLIAVGSENSHLRKIAGVLARESLEVQRVDSAARALGLLQREGADLLVVAHPPVDMKSRDLARAARRESARSRMPELVVLASGDQLRELEGLDGAPTLLNADRSGQELEGALLRLLGWTTPTPRRLWIRMEVELGAGKILRLCQTVNLSISGMLVQLNDEFPLGSQARFELRPGEDRDTIRGEAEIVRYSVPEVEGVRGMGLRFLGFSGDGRNRLQKILDRPASGS